MPGTLVPAFPVATLEVILQTSSVGMTVLIWLVQLIIYPSFRHTEAAAFPAWHRQYTGAISGIVVPLMLVQAGSGVWLLATAPVTAARLATAGVVAGAWIVTFAVSVPLHERLAGGKDAGAIERLIATNWWRTAAWTMAALLVWVT